MKLEFKSLIAVIKFIKMIHKNNLNNYGNKMYFYGDSNSNLSR